jgi:hypothetical protein
MMECLLAEIKNNQEQMKATQVRMETQIGSLAFWMDANKKSWSRWILR